ncbi:MAG: chromosome segregation protein SMC [Bacillota bacterium]|nr:chromosome segregation protein SMC [Bacillota bacterium]
MFLKSLEIRGFKSFADKVDLEFKKGITAVVGPNGSGKSNISDAVRWVLGEQSVKSLRGGKMEDVIFAGTQFRKPVGLAQVALTLDNSDGDLAIDYTDVTISRRLYRSGDSEYYINGTQCRLKDIQELFMDTGIGKEGYSIIGQGKIEAVLSGKPEERRSLLEEAAGITKFKTRKEEAEKKLESAEQNLIRINDIISTYEERLEPLRQESEKAKIFIDLSEKLKIREVNIIISSIEKTCAKVEELKSNLKDIDSKINNFLLDKTNSKIQLDSVNKELEDFELQTEEQKRSYYENREKYNNINNKINILRERVQNLINFIDKSNNELNELKSKISDVKLEKDKNEEDLSIHQGESTSLENELKQLEQKLNDMNRSLSEEDSLLRKLKDDEIEMLSNISNEKNNANLKISSIEQLESKITQSKVACEGYINTIKINMSTKAMLEEEIIKINEEIQSNNDVIKENRRKISSLSRQLASDEKEIKELNAGYNKLDANKNMLINFEKQYEGYNKSVKSLMQHIDKGYIPKAKNNCYVLGEVITVNQDYETAIEIALGGAISNLITEDEEISKSLINYLKEKSLGRATFLPLNIIKSNKLTVVESIKALKGYMGVASELIQYDKKFMPAIEYTLGRTVIVDNMDNALNIAKKSNYGFRIVTLSGEVVNPGGSLTGGSIYNKGSNVISRKREITELTEKIANTHREIEELSKKIESNKLIIKQLDDDCLNLKDDIHFKNIEITKIQGRISAVENESEKLRRSYSVTQNEISVAVENLEKAKNFLEDMQTKIKLLEENEKKNSATIIEIENKLRINSESMSDTKEKITELRIKKASLDEIITAKNKELERNENELKELLSKVELLEREVKNSIGERENSKIHIKNNEQEMQLIDEKMKEQDIAFKESEMVRAKLKENIKRKTSQLEQIGDVLSNHEEDRHKLQLSLTRLETENDAFYLKLNEELQLTYAEALRYKVEIADMNKYKKEVDELKTQISRLGMVNVSAIEEYKTVNEKYNFMNSQREDLIRGKNELLNVIEEMTQKMKIVFVENFKKLRENFNETFIELFKGGSADLILAGEDELTANIEINVQPPGKKLQNINLMSGGEKGLSAIALLFAILKMKPTPFCILDEIEAALDDANVARYAEFLNKFSGSSQFIVITHRKGTMEASDVLYGVTMEEKGVSKVVSVDLTRKLEFSE